MSDPPTNGFQEVLSNDAESLALFLRRMARFDRLFCALMLEGNEFSVRLEVRGNKHTLIHARVWSDDLERLQGVDQKLAAAESRLQDVHQKLATAEDRLYDVNQKLAAAGT